MTETPKKLGSPNRTASAQVASGNRQQVCEPTSADLWRHRHQKAVAVTGPERLHKMPTMDIKAFERSPRGVRMPHPGNSGKQIFGIHASPP